MPAYLASPNFMLLFDFKLVFDQNKLTGTGHSVLCHKDYSFVRVNTNLIETILKPNVLKINSVLRFGKFVVDNGIISFVFAQRFTNSF